MSYPTKPGGYRFPTQPYSRRYGSNLLYPAMIGPSRALLDGGGNQFLREVGGRSGIPGILTAVTANGRRGFYVRTAPGESLTQIKVAVANFICDLGLPGAPEVSSGGAMTVNYSIEYPASANPAASPGPRQLITWNNGAASLTSSAGILVSDLVTLNNPIPNGALARLWYRHSNTAQLPFVNVGPWKSVAALGDATIQSATDFTLSGTYSDLGNAFSIIPSRIMGMTSSNSDYCILGDSNSVGAGENDANQDATGNSGGLARALGAAHAYFRLSGPAGAAFQFLSSNARQLALAALAPPSNLIVEFGTNDLLQNVYTAVQIIANMQACATLINGVSNPATLATVPPLSTSTDGFATTGNQTTNATLNPVRNALNTLIRTTPGFRELSSFFATSPDTNGIWKAPGYTSDGIHSSKTANLTIPVIP